MKVKNIIYYMWFVFYLLSSFGLGAQELSKVSSILKLDIEASELRNKNKKKDESIEFISSSDQSSQDSIQNIRQIGINLSQTLQETNESAYYLDRYEVHRIIGKENSLGADVFMINEAASVNTIQGLRLIISAYISDMFAYDEKTSRDLAYLITIYNAYYYQDVSFFLDRYVVNISQYIHNDNIGLSQYYTEWAGKAVIIIPTQRQNVGDTEQINIDIEEQLNTNVINAMRQDKNDLQNSLDILKSLLTIQETKYQANNTYKDNGEILNYLTILEGIPLSELLAIIQGADWESIAMGQLNSDTFLLFQNSNVDNQVYLSILNLNDLSLSMTDIVVNPYGLFIQNEEGIYTIFYENDEWYVGLFNFELQLKYRSGISVDPSDLNQLNNGNIVTLSQGGLSQLVFDSQLILLDVLDFNN